MLAIPWLSGRTTFFSVATLFFLTDTILKTYFVFVSFINDLNNPSAHHINMEGKPSHNRNDTRIKSVSLSN